MLTSNTSRFFSVTETSFVLRLSRLGIIAKRESSVKALCAMPENLYLSAEALSNVKGDLLHLEIKIRHSNFLSGGFFDNKKIRVTYDDMPGFSLLHYPAAAGSRKRLVARSEREF